MKDKAVVVGYTDTIRTFKDNSCSLKINFLEGDKPDALRLFSETGTRVVIALLAEDIEVDPMRKVTEKEADEIEEICTTKIKYADKLYLSGFFTCPQVLEAILFENPGLLSLKEKKKWAWDTLKDQLGFESWSDIPLNIFLKWVDENNLDKFLPNKIKELMDDNFDYLNMIK